MRHTASTARLAVPVMPVPQVANDKLPVDCETMCGETCVRGGGHVQTARLQERIRREKLRDYSSLPHERKWLAEIKTQPFRIVKSKRQRRIT